MHTLSFWIRVIFLAEIGKMAPFLGSNVNKQGIFSHRLLSPATTKNAAFVYLEMGRFGLIKLEFPFSGKHVYIRIHNIKKGYNHEMKI